MDFVRYGCSEGRTVVYFHGVPGGPEEASLLEVDAKAANINLLVVDRFSVDSQL